MTNPNTAVAVLLLATVEACAGFMNSPLLVAGRSSAIATRTRMEVRSSRQVPLGLVMQNKPGTRTRIKSYYDVLGVQKKVGTDEIRRAYMGKAKTCHPDVNPSEDAAEQFMLINQAYVSSSSSSSSSSSRVCNMCNLSLPA
jgi:hypothetical protein